MTDTNIRVKIELRDRIDRLGLRGETFNQIVDRIVTFYERNHPKKKD